MGPVQKIEDGEDLCENSNRGSVGFANFHRRAISSEAHPIKDLGVVAIHIVKWCLVHYR
jgi:hypothetical protein